MASDRQALNLQLKLEPLGTGPANAADWDLHLKQFIKEPIKRAAYYAMQDTAETIKRQGRFQIAAGGFGERWQKAFIVNLYPKDRPSINAVIEARHKIPYAGIFEAGGKTKGNPLMWVPTKNAPFPTGRLSKRTPKRFIQQFGPLHGPRRTRKRKVPVLYGQVPGKPKKWVAMFFGIYEADHHSKFSIARAIRFGVDRFTEYYSKRLDEELSR